MLVRYAVAIAPGTDLILKSGHYPQAEQAKD